MEITIPPHFHCPISLELMKDPVTLSTGITYDRESIEKWIGTGHTTCPVTKQVLKTPPDLIPNHAVRNIIQDWCVQNRPYDIEPVLTPQIPITQYEVSEEYVLSSSFESYASVSVEKHACLLIEILSRLTWMFPLGVEAQSKLASSTSLRCMAWFLRGEDVSGRRVAVLALGELLALDQGYANAFAEMEGVAEALVKIIRVPICPRATKASLMAIYHMISPSTMSEEMTRRFMEMGLVSLILEIVVNYEKGICEKALGVLDCMCDCDDGREYLARNHESTMPVLVEKILGVSVTATEFLVSALWKLCKDENGGVVVDEAVHELGVFEKLLVVLQVGCDVRTKERANELLKLFTRYKERLDFDSSILFKHLKRPY